MIVSDPEFIHKICKKVIHHIEMIPLLGATNSSLSQIGTRVVNIDFYREKLKQITEQSEETLEKFFADSDAGIRISFDNERVNASVRNLLHLEKLSPEQLFYYSLVHKHLNNQLKSYVMKNTQLIDYLSDANPPLVPFASKDHVSYPPSKAAAMMCLAYGVEGMQKFLEITNDVPEEEANRFVPRAFEEPRLKQLLEEEGVVFPKDPIFVGPKDRAGYKDLQSEFQPYLGK
jgi:hypothetical protein